MREIGVLRQDILGFINRIETTVNTKETFLASEDQKDIIVFNLERIGEALKQMASKFPETSDNKSFREFSGLRDIVIHKYFDVDYELIWKIVKEDIPVLKRSVLDLKVEDA